jgi:hypothetical protein
MRRILAVTLIAACLFDPSGVPVGADRRILY